MFKKLLTTLSAYPRLRILLILVVLVVAFVVLLNVFSSGGSTNTMRQEGGAPASHNNSGNVSVKNGQRVSASQAERYKKLAGNVHQQQIARKVAGGESLFNFAFKAPSEIEHHLSQNNGSPTARAALDTTHHGFEDRIHQIQGAVSSRNVGSPVPPTAADNTHSQNNNNNQAEERQRAMAEQNRNQAWRNALQSASASWALPKFATVHGAASQQHQSIHPTSGQTHKASIKAGDIMFAVMDITANSDQKNTPVLATIVTGKYRGARLMGSFEREKDKLLIKFDLMTMPNWPNSVSINAYAISAENAQAALASYVNHHYLFRYGSLFAAAFLEGFGNAFNSYSYACPPGSSTCVVTGDDNLQSQKVTTKTAIFQGLGNIGNALSSAAQNNFNTPPTVKVYSGTGIGVLFMQDEYIPYPGNQQEMYGKVSL